MIMIAGHVMTRSQDVRSSVRNPQSAIAIAIATGSGSH